MNDGFAATNWLRDFVSDEHKRSLNQAYRDRGSPKRWHRDAADETKMRLYAP